MVYGLLRALPGDRAFLPPSSAYPCELDTSVGVPEPHGFAVRSSIVRPCEAAASTASHPAFVTIAIRPFVGETAGVIEMIWVWRERIYFFRWDWTDSIRLIWLNKLHGARRATQGEVFAMG